MIIGQGDKKQTYRLVSLLIGLVFGYIIMARVFMGLAVDGVYILQLYDLPLYGIPLGIIFLLAAWVPLTGQLKSQKESNKFEWLESLVLRPFGEPEDFFFPCKRFVKLNIDFTNVNTLQEKLNSELYTHYYKEYIRMQLEERIIQNKIEEKKGKEFWDKTEKYIQEILDNKGNVIDNIDFSNKMNKIAKETEINLKKIEPEKKFDLQKLVKDGELEEILKENRLKDFSLYLVFLGFEQKWEDDDKSFDHIFILLPGDKKELLETRPSWGWYKKWIVDLNACVCMFSYWFLVNKSAPLLYLCASENTAKDLSKFLKSINALTGSFIQFNVLVSWINDLEIRPEKLLRIKDFFQEKSKAFQTAFQDIIQDNAETKEMYGHFLETDMVRKQREQTEKYKRRTYLFGISIISILILFIILLSISFIL